MVVRHPGYGLGHIVALSGAGASRKATVEFPPPAGRKQFVLAASPLAAGEVIFNKTRRPRSAGSPGASRLRGRARLGSRRRRRDGDRGHCPRVPADGIAARPPRRDGTRPGRLLRRSVSASWS